MLIEAKDPQVTEEIAQYLMWYSVEIFAHWILYKKKYTLKNKVASKGSSSNAWRTILVLQRTIQS